MSTAPAMVDLDDDAVTEMLRAVELGCDLETAAHSALLDLETVEAAMAEDEELRARVQRAQARARVRIIADATKAAKGGDRKAAAWLRETVGQNAQESGGDTEGSPYADDPDLRDLDPGMVDKLVDGLNEKQRRFGEVWEPGMGPKAVEVAGYAAGTQGSRSQRANKLLKKPGVRAVIWRRGLDPFASRTTTHQRFGDEAAPDPEPETDDPEVLLRWQMKNRKLPPATRAKVALELLKRKDKREPTSADLDPLLALQRAVAEELRRDLGEGG